MATRRAKKRQPDVQLLRDHAAMCKQHADLMCAHVEVQSKYADLCRKLTKLLTPDQIDAAKTCGVTPEFYALEWIEINKEAWISKIPGFVSHVRNIQELRNG